MAHGAESPAVLRGSLRGANSGPLQCPSVLTLKLFVLEPAIPHDTGYISRAQQPLEARGCEGHAAAQRRQLLYSSALSRT